MLPGPTTLTLSFYQLLVYLNVFTTMKNTSISLGNHFDDFVSSQVASGRYKNVSEVIRAGLRLLEDEEHKSMALKSAVKQGMDSPLVQDFDFRENLLKLKANKKDHG
jgi:antitoxin ParD1/3/4